MLRLLTRLGAGFALTSSLAAQAPVARTPTAAPASAQASLLHAAGKDVTISLLTMGNGREIWELFGHDGLLIRDNTTGRDTVVNWGVFSFSQTHFLTRFLRGTMLYAMGARSMAEELYTYRYLNRTVIAQELDLTPAQRDTILRGIEWNARPENVDYRYDYFRDNCATRVRDILDRALGGQLRAQSQGLAGTTYRWHALRLMQSNRPIVLGVDIGLGRAADRELTRWEEMFLPRKLHDFVATMQVRDSAGALHPLVRDSRVVLRATQGAEPDAPPRFGLWLLAAGLGAGALLFWLGSSARGAHRPAAVRAAAALVVGLWAIAIGLLGTVVTLLWAATDHVFAHANENILLFNPLWLVLAGLAVATLWSGRAAGWTRRISAGLAVLVLAALAAHVGLSAQENLPLIGFMLPPTLAIAAVFGRPITVPGRDRQGAGRPQPLAQPGEDAGRPEGAAPAG